MEYKASASRWTIEHQLPYCVRTRAGSVVILEIDFGLKTGLKTTWSCLGLGPGELRIFDQWIQPALQ